MDLLCSVGGAAGGLQSIIARWFPVQEYFTATWNTLDCVVRLAPTSPWWTLASRQISVCTCICGRPGWPSVSPSCPLLSPVTPGWEWRAQADGRLGHPLPPTVIILSILEVIIILLLIFLRKRILIAIALIKEASRWVPGFWGQAGVVPGLLRP